MSPLRWWRLVNRDSRPTKPSCPTASLGRSRPPPPAAGRGQVLVCRDELLPEAGKVQPHVLPVQVHLLGHVPAALRDAGGVRQHGVARGVLAGQRALLGEDLVADVAQPHPRRGVAVVGAGGPVRAQRHHLDEHLPGPHEQEVRHGGAVHPDHRVAGVQLPVYLAQLRGAVGADHAHVEPDVRRQRRHVRLVLDHAGPRPRHDHQPGPPLGLVGTCRRRAGDQGAAAVVAVWAPARRAPLQALQELDAAAVSVVQEPAEVADAPALGRPRRVHGQLAVDAQPGDHLGEAVHAAVGAEVDRRELRQLGHHVAVLGHPPVVVLEDHQRHAPPEVARRHEERQDAVVELVVHVPRVPAGGEHHGRYVVAHVAPRGVAGGHAAQPHLVDRRHHVRLPLARVRPYPLLRRRVAGGHELERGAGRVHAQVPPREADVRALRRAVAAEAVVRHGRTRPGHPAARGRGRRRRAAFVAMHEGEEGHGRHEQRPHAEEGEQEHGQEAPHAERPGLHRLAALATAAAAVVLVVVHDPPPDALGLRHFACHLLLRLALPELQDVDSVLLLLHHGRRQREREREREREKASRSRMTMSRRGEGGINGSALAEEYRKLLAVRGWRMTMLCHGKRSQQ
jgi:hypothetical protein